MKQILTNQQYQQLDTNSKLDALFNAISSLPGNVSIGKENALNLPHKALERENTKKRLKAHFEQLFYRAYPVINL